MYRIEVSTNFQKKYHQLSENNKILQDKVKNTLNKLQENPFQASLKTHKVHVSKFDQVYSSWVTSDLRILWILQKKVCLLLLDIGGHSGNKSVYS